jgi:hypothetical protein
MQCTTHKLASTCFQPLDLYSDILVSSLCFQMQLVPLRRGASTSRRCLTLTTSTVKAIEQKIERGNYRDVENPSQHISAGIPASDAAEAREDERAGEQPSAGTTTPGWSCEEPAASQKGAPGPLHVNPKLFLHHVHHNTTLQVSVYSASPRPLYDVSTAFWHFVLLRQHLLYFYYVVPNCAAAAAQLSWLALFTALFLQSKHQLT